jgi:hypothetical protein
MAAKPSSQGSAQAYTWKQNSEDIIVLANRSAKNFILELPTGRCRLDAGRRMRTLRSILQYPQIQALVSEGSLTIE